MIQRLLRLQPARPTGKLVLEEQEFRLLDPQQRLMTRRDRQTPLLARAQRDAAGIVFPQHYIAHGNNVVQIHQEIELALDIDKVHLFEKDPPNLRIKTES